MKGFAECLVEEGLDVFCLYPMRKVSCRDRVWLLDIGKFSVPKKEQPTGTDPSQQRLEQDADRMSPSVSLGCQKWKADFHFYANSSRLISSSYLSFDKKLCWDQLLMFAKSNEYSFNILWNCSVFTSMNLYVLANPDILSDINFSDLVQGKLIETEFPKAHLYMWSKNCV